MTESASEATAPVVGLVDQLIKDGCHELATLVQSARDNRLAFYVNTRDAIAIAAAMGGDPAEAGLWSLERVAYCMSLFRAVRPRPTCSALLTGADR